MENNEQKRNIYPVYIEPERIEDIPLSVWERIKEGARGVLFRAKGIRLPGMLRLLSGAALALIVLLAAPVLPVAALIALLAGCCRSAFRAQAA